MKTHGKSNRLAQRAVIVKASCRTRGHETGPQGPSRGELCLHRAGDLERKTKTHGKSHLLEECTVIVKA